MSSCSDGAYILNTPDVSTFVALKDVKIYGGYTPINGNKLLMKNDTIVSTRVDALRISIDQDNSEKFINRKYLKLVIDSSEFSDESSWEYKTDEKLVLKTIPTTFPFDLDIIPKGARVKICGNYKNYTQVLYNGNKGWIFEGHLIKPLKLEKTSAGGVLYYLMQLGWGNWAFYLIMFILLLIYIVSFEKDIRQYYNIIYVNSFMILGIVWGVLAPIYPDFMKILLIKRKIMYDHDLLELLCYFMILFIPIINIIQFTSIKRIKQFPVTLLFGIGSFLFFFLLGHRLIDTFIANIEFIIGVFLLCAILFGRYSGSGSSSESSSEEIRNTYDNQSEYSCTDEERLTIKDDNGDERELKEYDPLTYEDDKGELWDKSGGGNVKKHIY
jgi:hypothetical protein